MEIQIKESVNLTSGTGEEQKNRAGYISYFDILVGRGAPRLMGPRVRAPFRGNYVL